jgi:hypothetical protein
MIKDCKNCKDKDKNCEVMCPNFTLKHSWHRKKRDWKDKIIKKQEE